MATGMLRGLKQRAEHTHRGVTDELVDGTVIFLHHRHQPVEAGIDYLTHFFGI